MHALRTSTTLPRLILAWFVLVLGVAAASPVVRPVSLLTLCTAEGLKTIAVSHDGQAHAPDRHTLDCPLCLPTVLAPLAVKVPVDAPSSQAHRLLPRPPAHIATLVGAPLPARGPPPA